MKNDRELSGIAQIKHALTLAKSTKTGYELSQFDVIELLGFITDMEQVYKEDRAYVTWLRSVIAGKEQTINEMAIEIAQLQSNMENMRNEQIKPIC
jgi:hypothetical protein